MAHRYDRLREKAVRLRTEQQLSLDAITERLSLPRTTIYSWIKDIPIPEKPKHQHLGQRQGTEAMQAKYAALREAAYQQGLAEALELLRDLSFRDFVVLYMAEGSKRNRNAVEFVNSDAQLVKLAHRWISVLTDKDVTYRIQFHADHDVEALKRYWGGILGIESDIIGVLRKSNSGKLARRQFRSQYGLLSCAGRRYLSAGALAGLDGRDQGAVVKRGVAQPGSAFALGARGPGFKSRHPDLKVRQLLPIMTRECGYGVAVAHDPSKVLAPVRIRLPAHRTDQNSEHLLAVFCLEVTQLKKIS